MKRITLLLTLLSTLALTGCYRTEASVDSKAVKAQQGQYDKSQPIPMYNWSLERHLLIELYNSRNLKAVTHSVWRSDYGMIEGDCSSIGFGIPYDTSLTNPSVSVDRAGNARVGDKTDYSLTSVGQPEPNGIFASTNTSATWIMCAGDNGAMDPVYVESKVTVYPYPVHIDYDKNRVTKAGSSTVSIK